MKDRTDRQMLSRQTDCSNKSVWRVGRHTLSVGQVRPPQTRGLPVRAMSLFQSGVPTSTWFPSQGPRASCTQNAPSVHSAHQLTDQDPIPGAPWAWSMLPVQPHPSGPVKDLCDSEPTLAPPQAGHWGHRGKSDICPNLKELQSS